MAEATLRERVDGEWSFLDALRHLIFVTNRWIAGRVLGRTNQFRSFGMPPRFTRGVEPYGIDMSADRWFAEVVADREARMDIGRELVRDITGDGLQRRCGEEPMRSCLYALFDEVWHHNWFANRDLDVLERA